MSMVLNWERVDDGDMDIVHLGLLALATPAALATLYRSFRDRPSRSPVRSGYDTRRPTL
ncbi:hypothetical protein WHI96_00840 [Pseudonocardia tropica]|uniref:Uncharacterized protein n=1 Tax=Pseudonocardia tropica TaxID=681289 RepID=A0ABV1JN50_9PSEU